MVKLFIDDWLLLVAQKAIPMALAAVGAEGRALCVAQTNNLQEAEREIATAIASLDEEISRARTSCLLRAHVARQKWEEAVQMVRAGDPRLCKQAADASWASDSLGPMQDRLVLLKIARASLVTFLEVTNGQAPMSEGTAWLRKQLKAVAQRRSGPEGAAMAATIRWVWKVRP